VCVCVCVLKHNISSYLRESPLLPPGKSNHCIHIAYSIPCQNTMLSYNLITESTQANAEDTPTTLNDYTRTMNTETNHARSITTDEDLTTITTTMRTTDPRPMKTETTKTRRTTMRMPLSKKKSPMHPLFVYSSSGHPLIWSSCSSSIHSSSIHPLSLLYYSSIFHTTAFFFPQPLHHLLPPYILAHSNLPPSLPLLSPSLRHFIPPHIPPHIPLHSFNVTLPHLSSIHPLFILYSSSIHPLFISYSSSIHPLFILYQSSLTTTCTAPSQHQTQMQHIHAM
jgi:hypothetical protein